MATVVLYARSGATTDEWFTDFDDGSIRVRTASSVPSVRDAVASADVDVVVVDERAESSAVDGAGDDVAARTGTVGVDGAAGIDADGAGGWNGLAAVSAVRDVDDDVPVVFRSAESDGELAAAATRAGATEYFPADAVPDSLADRVRSHVRSAGTDASAAAGHPAEPAGGERYEQIVEAVDDGVYAVDEDARLVYVNEAMERLTGYDRAELLGERIWIIASGATVAEATEAVERLRDGAESPATVEFELERADGETVPCEDHLTLLVDEDGEFDGTAGVIRDVTDRKRRDRRLSKLLETSGSLLRARSPRDVADVVATATQEALGQDFSVVRLLDEEADELVPVARAGHEVRDRPAYPVGGGGPGTAFARGEILRFRDVPDEPVGDVGYVEDVLYVPLGDRGVLSVVTTDPDGLDAEDESMAEILASTAAVALDRAGREAELGRYRTVIENVQDMVYVIDADERFTLVTEPLADWLGYDREELVGVHPELIMVDGEVDTFESTIAELWHEADEDASRRVETELVTADGDRRQAEVEVSLYPAAEGFTGTVGVVRDVSELVRTRQLLADQRDRFSYLFDNLPDPVVEASLDEDGSPEVREVNDAFTDVFGFGPGEVVGESLNDFILPADAREEGLRLDREAASGDVTNREVRRKTADGYRDLLFRGIPYDRTEEGMLSFGIYTDITAQKERERRLEVLNRVLRHNLRNDVNVLVGYAEMLAEDATDETQRARARALHEKASDLAALSDRARSLDETMRHGSPRDSAVALEPLVDEVVDRYAGDHPSLRIETDVDPVRVVGDDRLGLALRELFDNVVEHAGSDATVRVETVRDDREHRLRVVDDGPGVPADERAVLTGSEDITQLRHGSGLGLWIVKWVCESCGGRLEFDDGAGDPDGAGDGSAVVLSLSPVGDS